MGQSLACCSEPSICRPATLPTPRPHADKSTACADTGGEGRETQQKVPVGLLLKELEIQFDKYANVDHEIGAPELAKIWQKCAESKVGGDLTKEDKRLIKESARTYLQTMDVNQNGRVDHSEFCSFMLGGLDRRGPFGQMQETLRRKLEEKPGALHQAIAKFVEWDTNGDGYITPEELRVQMDKFMNDKGVVAAPFSMDDILSAVDVDADGRIDLWEFLAYSMGRRKVPVELLLYDITQGNSELFSSVLLGNKFEAIYHSSVWFLSMDVSSGLEATSL